MIKKLTKLLSLMVLFVLLSNLANGQTIFQKSAKLSPLTLTKESNNIVTIAYNQPIENFKIKVYWVPKKISFGDMLIGSAIIEFKNITDSNVVTLCDNSYGIYLEKLPASFITVHKDENTGSKFTINQKNLNLSYDFKDANKVRANFDHDCHIKKLPESKINESIIFTDLDFDGNTELLICSFGTGQRECNEYNVYECQKFSENLEINVGISNSEHYLNNIDDYTYIDHNTKTVFKYLSGGICEGSLEVYDVDDSKGYKELIQKFTIENNEIDGYNCSRNTYQLKLEKKLISNKSVPSEKINEESFYDTYKKALNK